MKPAWYTKKWVIILMHSATWVLLFSLPFLLRPSYTPSDNSHPHPANDHDTADFLVARINDCVLISFFYLNSLLLVPRFFYKKRYILYCVTILAYFAFFVMQGWLVKRYLNPDIFFTFRKHLFFSVFVFMFILACSIAYKTIRDRIIADRHAQEKENEFLKTELSLLRSQVSPHFMFNVLNNMVALARKQSDQLEPSLIKLSSLMRYMLYETEEEKVSLEKETEYLQSYIDLQQQRFGKKVEIDVAMKPADKTYFIEPMLLIPFVENAFKHGVSIGQTSGIAISIVLSDRKLNFSCINTKYSTIKKMEDEKSGIGLENVKRRLDLLYPDKHHLQISEDEGKFIVKLELDLE